MKCCACHALFRTTYISCKLDIAAPPSPSALERLLQLRQLLRLLCQRAALLRLRTAPNHGAPSPLRSVLRQEPAGPVFRRPPHARAARPAGAAGRRCQASHGASAATRLRVAPARRHSRRCTSSGAAGCCCCCLLRCLCAGGSAAPRDVGSARSSALRRRVRGVARHRVRHTVLRQAAVGRPALQRAHPALGQTHLGCATHTLNRALCTCRSRRLGPVPRRLITRCWTHLTAAHCVALRCAAAAASDARHCAALPP